MVDRRGMIIRPYVFRLDGRADRAAERLEVAEVVWARLRPLSRGAKPIPRPRYLRDGHDLTLPAFDVGGRTVWGLTYQMLRTLLDRLR